MPRSEFGWSLCYLSEVSLVVAWLLKCNISRLFLWTSKKFLKQCGTHISCVQNRLFISSECPFHALWPGVKYFQVYIITLFFLWLQRSIGQPKVIFYTFQKIIIKKRITPPKKLWLPAILLDHFYLLISLEGMSTFIRSRASFQDQIWDVHLYDV